MANITDIIVSAGKLYSADAAIVAALVESGDLFPPKEKELIGHGRRMVADMRRAGPFHGLAFGVTEIAGLKLRVGELTARGSANSGPGSFSPIFRLEIAD